MKSNILDRVLKRMKLTTKLKVLNEMAFIDLLTTLGYRENKGWTPEEDEILQKLMDAAKKHTEHQIEEIKEHILEKLKLNDEQAEILSKTT